jgi:hypothetical protein
MKVIGFQTIAQLQAYITAEGLLAADVVAVYFDGASGQHVLVYTP